MNTTKLKSILKFSFIITTILFLSIGQSLSFVFASTTANLETQYLEDGSYFETLTEETPSNISLFSTTKNKSASRTKAYHSSSGAILWSITIHATFSYNGSSSKCTSCSSTKKVNNSNWKVSLSTCTKSANSASVSGTGKKYSNGALIKTISETSKLSCKANGTLY